jgi:hypothetical protein
MTFVSVLSVPLSAMAASGVIDSSSHTAQLCYEPTCSMSPNMINWKPTVPTADAVIIDDAAGLSGWIWGNTLGWINLHPTGSGVSLDAATGQLSGRAWSQVSGWVNFNPTGPDGVVIDSNGQFTGYAWTGGPEGGWIKFDCGSTASCVKTNWRPLGAATPPGSTGKLPDNGGGGGGGGPATDMCPNIKDIQSSIPSGYSLDAKGNCIQKIDICPNLPGDQSSIPRGYEKTSIDSCVPKIDQCPNIDGIQSTIPLDNVVTKSGDCTEFKKTVKENPDVCPETAGVQSSYAQCTKKDVDVCTNLPGLQQSIPDGYSAEGKSCILTVTDICPNISGKQSELPVGLTINVQGNCVDLITDVCPNLPGDQTTIPETYQKKGLFCVMKPLPGEKPQESSYPTRDEIVIAYPFVPKSIQIPVKPQLLDTAIVNLDTKFNTGIVSGQDYKVDLVSALLTFAVTVSGLTIFLYLIYIGVRMMQNSESRSDSVIQ